MCFFYADCNYSFPTNTSMGYPIPRAVRRSFTGTNGTKRTIKRLVMCPALPIPTNTSMGYPIPRAVRRSFTGTNGTEQTIKKTRNLPSPTYTYKYLNGLPYI